MTARDDIDLDELRKMLQVRDDKKVALPEPFMELHAELTPVIYNAWKDQMESYAAARVAEATAELRTKLADAEASDAESMALYRSARARADELQRRVAELEANDRRYRFLRDTAHTISGMSPAVLLATEHFDIDVAECGGFIFEEELDSTIDAILTDREGGKA